MIAYSWTCLRDFDLVHELHKQFFGTNIRHYYFVEEREYDEFCGLLYYGHENVIKRRNGGDNGFGKDGALAKRDCIEQVLKLAQPGETLLECDSDVRFITDCIRMFECKPNRYKGFTYDGQKTNWPYFTGCIKSYDYSLGRKLIDSNPWDTISELIGQGITPSEDAFLSYSFHKLGGKFVDMSEVLKLGVQMKQYDSNQHDIMS